MLHHSHKEAGYRCDKFWTVLKMVDTGCPVNNVEEKRNYAI